MNIFLDACIIIYWIEAAEPFYSQLLSKLELIAQQYPNHTLNVSRLSFIECLAKPMREENKTALEYYRQFFEMDNLQIIEINPTVIDIATEIRAKCKIKTPDTIQAASCLSMNKEHLFLSNDKGFSAIKSLSSITIS